jgi:hypothetical protein
VSQQLVLNIAPISFGDTEIEVDVHRYESKEQLQQLRARTRSTHVVRREGADKILCAPLNADAVATGGSRDRILLSRHLGLVVELIRNALIDYIKGYDRVVLQREPIVFLADGPQDELLGPCVPPGVTRPAWMSCRTVFEVAPRRLGFNPAQQAVGIAVGVRTRRIISATCDSLLDAGISPLGHYVGRLVPADDPRLSDRFELAGRVSAISQGQLHLEDARPEATTINATEARLDPGVAAFDFCLDRVFGGNADGIRDKLDARRWALQAGDERLGKLRRFIDWLGRQTFVMSPGASFKVGSFLAEHRQGFPNVLTASTPVYVFDPTGARTSLSNSKGLHDHGPYSAPTFTPNRPRICIICQRALKGQVEQFLHKFFNGIPAHDSTSVFTRGLVGEYRLEGLLPEFFLAEGESAEAYHRAAQKALEFAAEKDMKWDLALVQSYERTHDLPGPSNPYLVTKATFLAQNIPSQQFEIETAQYNEPQLRYSLSNMALATYAKLNGVPWLLKASPTIAHELVIGLGSAQIGRGRLGDRRRVVGITTVFTGDGNYWLSNLSEAVPYDDYPQAILESLRKAIEHSKRVLNWQPREHIRLIFHAFKPLKDAEADAVISLVKELGDYDVEVSFIHVVEDHPYLLFDEAQPGIAVYGGKEKKGVWAPARGVFFPISRREVLITLTGAKELKQPSDGMPRPLVLRLHRSSTFEDLTYLARQAFAFSSHSWKSFLPAPRPVTILYSDLMAHHLSRLEEVPRWNPDCMLGRIGRTRWFL